MNKNIFLPDINNENPLHRNKTYKQNLLSLNKLVLIKFAEDETVRPAESAVILFQGSTLEFGRVHDMLY
jgi:palmitoyl-protein thioesterase